ncbi:hypothetical protein GCM10010495_76570 [Kitasatospora herbaricolor]|uniref:hypothetical protein n=1 Tax=Kitasatospora herbaricolor TaxID=68217 RepID=UPI00174BA7C3|nr:hypothetical protein [Kitasatospora herbaricolor]MDQ0305526.1 post-segregation antitoxin (ccd killing protein) [Kitasatospora herbaricolor]GGV47590.1 hypothetical protein GCM10010495_76570 [Kitasatospora herbaricolor]
MAKVSVSIPDDLLARAQALHEGDNVSQLVQRGLALLAPKEKPYRPDWAAEELAAAAGRLREAARADYEDGFRAGYELAKTAPWDWVLWLANEKFSLRTVLGVQRSAEFEGNPWADEEMLRACRSSEGWPSEWFTTLGRVFNAETAPPRLEESAPRSDQFFAGAEQAFRDVWAYVNQPPGS